MKKIFIVVSVLCFFNKAFAQSYTPMLEIGKIWNMRHFNDYGGWFDFNLEVTETVEINNLTYYHIESTHNNCETFLREDISEKKIYGIWEAEEYLHYDFSLDIGDYIIVYGIPRLITDIGYGDFFGMENLRYYLLDNTIKLIEGIGFEMIGIADSFEYGCLFVPIYEFVQLINMNQPLSINEITTNIISIYPNPVTDVLSIDKSTIKIESVKIYNMLGKLLFEVSGNFQQINVSSLKSGVYLVKFGTDRGVVSKKVIKE